MKKLIFYTDLDGTLLNHDDYSWFAAGAILKELKELNIPVVFNTSKTLKEVQSLQQEMGIYDPFVIENGGAVSLPANYFSAEPGRIVVLGKDIETILELIKPLRTSYKFESYSQMTPERISELTGLTVKESINSSQRICSEPLVWNDSEENLNNFKESLKEMDLDLLKGGRFYHIIGLSGKGDALRFINDKYEEEFKGHDLLSIALGDSPNDLSMLEEADLAVVIPRADGTYLSTKNKNIINAEFKGAKGWACSAEKILNELSMRSVK